MAKKKFNKNLLFYILIVLLITASTGYMLYSVYLLKGIETFLRIVFSLTIFAIWLSVIVSSFKSKKKQKNKLKLALVFIFIYSLGLSIVSFYVNKAYNAVDNMTTDSTTYTTSLVTLSSNKVKNIKKISDGSIGILADSTSIVGNTLPNEVIENKKLKNEVLEYDNFVELIQALLDKKVEYAFLPANYVIMFSEMEGTDFKDLETKTKIIYTKSKKIKDEQKENKKLDKPFTILLMGVDSELENIANASFNGDSLMVITFNPTTLSSTILSIPRDSYVPIACFPNQRKNKITHAAWYGEQCMIDTIQNFTGITIDYYVKINFKGVVNLVNQLGGVEIDVPYAFCEQNSSRQWGNNTVYVEKGLQTLNGEQALAYSRNRHSWPAYCGAKYSNYYSDDFIRGQHQQEVVKALLNKLKDVRSINTVTELLNTISSSMETNMSTTEILSLYNIGKDILVKSKGQNVVDLISMQRLYLNGQDAYIYDQSMKLNLYDYVLYNNSVEAVSNAMKANLGLIEPDIEKSFSFSIDKEYEQVVIGKKETGSTSVVKLPDFTGDTESQAKITCNKLGITCTFKTVTTGNGNNGTVISQSYNAGYDISYVSGLTLNVLKKTEEKQIDKKDDSSKKTTDTKSDSSKDPVDSNKDDDSQNDDDKKSTDNDQDDDSNKVPDSNTTDE